MTEAVTTVHVTADAESAPQSRAENATQSRAETVMAVANATSAEIALQSHAVTVKVAVTATSAPQSRAVIVVQETPTKCAVKVSCVLNALQSRAVNALQSRAVSAHRRWNAHQSPYRIAKCIPNAAKAAARVGAAKAALSVAIVGIVARGMKNAAHRVLRAKTMWSGRPSVPLLRQ